MPVSDPRAGSAYIWIVSAVLFLAIIAGGTLLVLYMVLPVSKPWFPIAGVSLVCLPWLFWLFTFLYRILSRLCCGRGSAVADGGPSVGEQGFSSGSADAAAAMGGSNDSDSPATTPSGGRRVHFGGAVVVDPNQQHQAERGGDLQEEKNVNQGSVSSSSSSEKENSFASHESEIPLTLSMHS